MAVTIKTYPSSLPTVQDINNDAVPTVAEDVVSEEVFLEYAEFNATSGNNAVVTLSDKQGTAVEIFRVEVTDKGPVKSDFAGRRCPGGLTWVASATGITGYLKWRK